jgi:hypothetical protein
MMFGAFDSLSAETSKVEVKVKAETKRRSVLRFNAKWLAGIAAAVVIVVGVMITLNPRISTVETTIKATPDYICYVNGVKVEDDKVAYAEANRILGSLSEDMQLAMAEVNRLTHYTIAK